MSRLGCKNKVPSDRATAQGEKRTRYTGKLCAKHPEEKGVRLTTTGHCYVCSRDAVKKGQQPGGSQHARARAYTKQWYQDNKDYVASRSKEKRTPEMLAAGLARLAAWNKANPDKAKLRYSRYQKAAHGKNAAKEARRRAEKAKATPLWANSFFIEEIYALAKLREKVCGGKWHVDHIVPLKSHLVCGLHVESNLRVVPARVNLTKSNTYWPNMPS